MILPSPEHGLRQPVTDTNMQDSFELFLLGDEEKKVTEAIDTRKCTPFVLVIAITVVQARSPDHA